MKGQPSVLEDMDHARARGSVVLAEIVGFGMTSDADDIVRPNQEGAARAMRAALHDAGLELAMWDMYQCPRDRNQTERRDRGGGNPGRWLSLPLSATKSMHGHLMGATGAVELLAVIMARFVTGSSPRQWDMSAPIRTVFWMWCRMKGGLPMSRWHCRTLLRLAA